MNFSHLRAGIVVFALLPCSALADKLRPAGPLHADGELFVSDVFPDSPAARAGIQINDVLVRVGGTPLASCPDLVQAVKDAPDRLTLDVLRAGQPRQLAIDLKATVSGSPRLGIACTRGSADVAATRTATLQFSAVVNVTADLVIVGISVINRSGSPLTVTPDQFSMADATHTLLRPMSMDDVDGVIREEHAASAARKGAGSGANGVDFAAQAALSSLGIAGPAARLASGLLDRASDALAGSGSPAHSSTLEADEATIRRLSLATSKIEAGFQARGLIFFAPTITAYPVTLRMNVAGDSITLDFVAR